MSGGSQASQHSSDTFRYQTQNFLIQRLVKHTNFGLSEFGTSSALTNCTPGYKTPEVIEAVKSGATVTNKCDMWSLGSTMYEVLMLEYLVKNIEPGQCKPNPRWEKADKSLHEIIELCKNLIRTNPEKRMSADKFAQKIKKVKLSSDKENNSFLL